jgi:hypothetical protein
MGTVPFFSSDDDSFLHHYTSQRKKQPYVFIRVLKACFGGRVGYLILIFTTTTYDEDGRMFQRFENFKVCKV